ncbi:MAG: TIGR04283 family arsenosugar biosynthesis glycosyltransferase [Verrucomicrobia bacterium]|nr:TIGR04283 family arsenosugar biosynthesis glycosyltransferase [Verrucomicrobiota bacterium]
MPAELRGESISIIVPVCNEAAGIGTFLKRLRERAPAAELIVVDGASDDGTAQIAAALCDQLIKTGRGRARQMNAGARAATREILWFLHADTEPPRDCVQQVESTLRDRRVAGGYFRIQLPRDRMVYRLTDSFAHYAGKVLRIRCGDHGLFCRREMFERIGGFPEVALMEDVEFFRALRRCGRVRSVNSRLIISARRYEEIGPAKLTLAYGLIATLYALGAPLPLLSRVYRRTCSLPAADSIAVLNTCGSRSNVASRSRSA